MLQTVFHMATFGAFSGAAAATGGGGGAIRKSAGKENCGSAHFGTGGGASAAAAESTDMFERIAQHALANVTRGDIDADYRTYLGALLNAAFKRSHDLLQDAHNEYITKLRSNITDAADNHAVDTVELQRLQRELAAITAQNDELRIQLQTETQRMDGAIAELTQLRDSVTATEACFAAERTALEEELAARRRDLEADYAARHAHAEHWQQTADARYHELEKKFVTERRMWDAAVATLRTRVRSLEQQREYFKTHADMFGKKLKADQLYMGIYNYDSQVYQYFREQGQD